MSLRKKLKLDENSENEIVSDESAESKYFLPVPNSENHYADNLLRLETKLSEQLKSVTFESPVHTIYNPLEYAYETHSMYVRKYCSGPKKLLFLGINPGPWGMAQTGVPFGEVNLTRDWLGISGPVTKPSNEITARLITGFECHRSEISGKKIWSFFQDLCGTPNTFFEHAYVHNYCPLLLMKSSGANITPADLKKTESRRTLLALCDESLAEVLKLLEIELVIGIGRFAQQRSEETIKTHKLNNIRVETLIHPSPRIPNNQNWHLKAKQTFIDLKILNYFTKNEHE